MGSTVKGSTVKGWNIYTLEGPKGWYAQVTAADGRFGESEPNRDTESDAVAEARENAMGGSK